MLDSCGFVGAGEHPQISLGLEGVLLVGLGLGGHCLAPCRPSGCHLLSPLGVQRAGRGVLADPRSLAMSERRQRSCQGVGMSAPPGRGFFLLRFN